jgi:hypothetical protein
MNARTCQRCGCTDDHACVDTLLGPCYWVGPDQCSSCYPELDRANRCPDHMPSMPEVATHFKETTQESCHICWLIPGAP